eukprot:s2125_g3.t1
MGWLAQLLQLTHGQEAHPTSLVEESNRESLPEVLDPHFRQQVEDFYRHTINDIHSDMQMLKAYASAADASEKASFLEVKSASLDPRVCFLPSGRPSSYLLTKKLGRGHHKRTMFDELESEDQEAEQAEEDGKAEGEGKEKEEWTPAKSFNKASKEMGGGGIKKDAMFPNMRNMLSEDGDEKYEMKEKDLMAGGGNQKDGMLGKGVGKGGQEDVMLGKGLGKGYQKDALRSADEQETEEEGPHLFYSGGDKKDMQLVSLQGTNHPSATSPPSQSSVPSGNVSIPSSFAPDWECYDSNSVSNKKFFRNIQSTPWSTKSGLAGKDIANLRVTELTRKGLDDFSLRCLSNGEFQSLVFVRSISEAVFVSNLLRHIRQDRIDLDAVAANMHGPRSISEAVFVSNLLRHIRQDRIDLDAVAANMHGPAPPDKHNESARFMQPLLGEVVSTIKSHAPAPAASGSQSPESAELAKAKRKLQEAGIALTQEKKTRAAQNSPSSTGPSLPSKGTKTSAEEILEKETAPPSAVPGSTSNGAVEKWLKKHQSQFRGQASAFKKHVADVCSVFQASETTKQDLAETAVRYGLQKTLADRMSFHNLSTFIGACQFQAA